MLRHSVLPGHAHDLFRLLSVPPKDCYHEATLYFHAISFSRSEMKKLSSFHWIFLLGLGVLLFALVGYNFYLLFYLGIWKVYFSLLAVFIALLVIVSCI